MSILINELLSLSAIQIFPLLSMIFMLGLGIFVLQSKKDLLGLLFFLISIVFAVWTFGTFMMFIAKNDTQIIFWDRFVYLGIVCAPAFQYHFNLLITKFTKKRRILLIIAYILAVFFLIASRSNYFLSGVFHYRWGAHTEAGILHHFFIAYFFFYIFALLYNLFLQIRDSRIKVEKFKLWLITAAFMILNLVGGIGFLPAYKISIYSPISLLAPLAFSIIVGFVIFRYRFMDIRIAVKKFFVYFGLTIYAFVILISFSWFILVFSNKVTTIYIVVVAGIVAVLFIAGFYLLELILVKVSNKYFFANLYNYHETIRQLSRELTHYNDLKEIVNLIVGTIKSTIKLDCASVLIINHQNSQARFEVAKAIGFTKKEISSLTNDNFLNQYLEKNQEPLVADELALLLRESKKNSEKNSLQKLYEKMSGIKVSICLPLINEKNLIGIIVLGTKLSGGAYTNEDLELLSVLANQAGIAINNARLYQQVNDFNLVLRKKVDEQTKQLKKEALELAEKNVNLNKLLGMKNDFLRVVNHQLNTPVSIIRNSIYMIRSGSFPLEKGLSFIEDSLKKMDEIINEFWKAFSFEGDGVKLDLQEANPEEILEKLVSSFSELPLVKDRKLAIKINKNINIPQVKIDPKQFTQAVSNLLQNAISYTNRGSITVYFENLKNDLLKVFIEDTGVGIDEEDKGKIFEKFVRGKRAISERPGGSGLGLYIAKRIIEAGGGQLKLEKSEVGKGTTFSFTVPIWK
jgi:signal transduction histidine kinase